MDETEASSFWCHMCNQTVTPVVEVEPIKCPICRSGFVEEMAATAAAPDRHNDNPFDFEGSESDRALSLWAPILLGMMNNPRRVRRLRRLEFEDDDDDNNEDNHYHHHHRRRHHHHRRHHDLETDLDRELESIFRMRRRRSSANILQLIHGIQSGTLSGDRDRDHNDGGEHVVLINPFNSLETSSNNSSQNIPTGSLGDYFVGPGLDLLLQHLSENDPNRYGTPPAQKHAVEALPNVTLKETLQCSVCLEHLEMGGQAKEMPCKHKFHGECILPWLELHSSCPVCRHQLPSEESKIDLERSTNNNSDDSDGRNDNGRRFSLPWPFNSLFSSSSNANSASTTSSEQSSSTNAPRTTSRRHEN